MEIHVHPAEDGAGAQFGVIKLNASGGGKDRISIRTSSPENVGPWWVSMSTSQALLLVEGLLDEVAKIRSRNG